MTDPDPLAEVLRALRRDYLRDSLARMAELEALLATVEAGGRDALDALRRALHKLAGSGGSYGLDDVSRHSRDGEHAVQRMIAAGGAPQSADQGALRAAIAAVAAAFAVARAGAEDVAGG